MNPPEPLLVQGVAFALAGLTGVALGLWLDALRAVRRALRPPRWIGHMLDAASVALALPVAAAGLLAANWGEVRVYPLLAMLLGGTLYLTLGSPVVLPAWTWILRISVRLLVALAMGLSWPVRAPLEAGVRVLTGLVVRWRRAHGQGPPKPPDSSDSA